MNSCACASLRGRDDLGVARARAAVADIVADRAVQQRGVLRHHRDLRAQAFLRDVGDVLAVDQDAALFEVEEAQQQVDQRRLAGAGAADQADLLARLDRRGVSPSISPLCAAVAEAHVVEAHLAARDRERRGVRRLSTSVCGRAMVSMPSCTTPTFSKMPVTCQATQPEAATICVVIGSAMATVPTPTWPRRQSTMAKAPVDGDQQRVEQRQREREQRVEPQRSWKRPVCWSTASRT